MTDVTRKTLSSFNRKDIWKIFQGLGFFAASIFFVVSFGCGELGFAQVNGGKCAGTLTPVPLPPQYEPIVEELEDLYAYKLQSLNRQSDLAALKMSLGYLLAIKKLELIQSFGPTATEQILIEVQNRVNAQWIDSDHNIEIRNKTKTHESKENTKIKTVLIAPHPIYDFPKARDQTRATSFSFSPDGQFLLTTYLWNRIKVWDLKTKKPQFALDPFVSSNKTSVFSPDGRWIASGSSDMIVRIWDTTTRKLTHELKPPPPPEPYVGPARRNPNQGVLACSFFNDGHRIAAADSDGQVRIWDYLTGELLKTFHPNNHGLFNGTITSLQLTQDGQRILLSTSSGKVGFFKSTDGSMITKVSAHGLSTNKAILSPNEKLIGTVGSDGLALLWNADLSQQVFLHPLQKHTHQILSASFSHDGQIFATSTTDGLVTLFDTETGRLLSQIDLRQEKDHPMAVFHPKENLLVTRYGGTSGRLWSLSGEIILDDIDQNP